MVDAQQIDLAAEVSVSETDDLGALCLMCDDTIEPSTHVVSIAHQDSIARCHADCVMSLLNAVNSLNPNKYVTASPTPRMMYGPTETFGSIRRSDSCLACSSPLAGLNSNEMFVLEGSNGPIGCHVHCWEAVDATIRELFFSEAVVEDVLGQVL